MTGKRMWGGRFKGGPDSLLLRVNASIHFDQRMIDQDVLGSIAQARMLEKIAILSEGERAEIEAGLLLVLKRYHAGELALSEELEDVHTHVEHELSNHVDPQTAGRLHTGRSRNDQVALDVCMWLRDEVGVLRAALTSLIELLSSRATDWAEIPCVGLTHLQSAQPVTVGHHIMAYAVALTRDLERVQDLRRRIRFCPLGSGSLAGSPLPLDRAYVAEQLGFEGGPSLNSMDSVASRDLLVEACAVAAVAGLNLSRLAEDLILWASPAQGWITLPDECCTGSSLMPQKKNPDGLELVRGKSGRILGRLMGLATVLKGLPMSYNKDLQEDKEACFDALDTLQDMIALTQLSLAKAEIRADRCLAAVHADGFLMATDLADYLVLKKVPFRDAHHIVGTVVAHAEQKSVGLKDLSLDEYQNINPAFEADLFTWLDPERSIARRSTAGGPAPDAVRATATQLHELCAQSRRKIEAEHGPCPLLNELIQKKLWTGLDPVQGD